MVYLRGLCEFPVCWLDFWTFILQFVSVQLQLLLSYFLVTRRLLKPHGINIQETGWILILSTHGDPVEGDTFVRLMYRALNQHIADTTSSGLH